MHCSVNEESLKLAGSSGNDRSLDWWSCKHECMMSQVFNSNFQDRCISHTYQCIHGNAASNFQRWSAQFLFGEVCETA